MRIGIDCRTIVSSATGELAGTAQYTSALVAHLLRIDKENTYVLFFDARIKNSGDPFSVNYRERVSVNVERVFLPVSRIPLLTTHWFLARALRRAKLDLFHSPAHPLPLFYRGRMVWTVHDLAIYDHPEWFPGGMRQWFSTRVSVPYGMHRAARLIVPSESTKKDVQRIFKIPDEKIRVVYEGASSTISNVKAQILPPQRDPAMAVAISKPYFLFIGTIEPRKNIARLIDAFVHFRTTSQLRNFATSQLVLAGSNGWKNADVFQVIKKANDMLGRDAVRYLGYVSEEEKSGLLKGAAAFVWPSLYEGFGLPVLEAMAAGVPVITSNVSSIPEITGDAALLIDPEHVEGLAEAMQRVVEDENFREQLKKRGVIRAQQFTWEKAAQETLVLYQSVFSRPSSA